MRIFRQEQLHELEQWLSQAAKRPIQLAHRNPARRPLQDLADAEYWELEQQVRWLYAVDAHAFGYPKANSLPMS